MKAPSGYRHALLIGDCSLPDDQAQGLQFYYDCRDKLLHRCDYKLIQMDTDSLYLGLSCDSLEEVVYPAMAEKFQAYKKEWFAWDKWSAREWDFSSWN